MGKKTFRTKVLARLNKSEEEIEEDMVDEKIDRYIIEIEGNISTINTVEIPNFNRDIKTAENNLKYENKRLEASYEELGSDFQNYTNNIKRSEQKVENLKAEVSAIKVNIADSKEEKERLESLLTRLKS